MGVSKIQITDMPGPSWWEFMLQWGGIFIQAAAAAGTLWAVVVALRVATRGEVNRLAEYEERGVIVAGVVLPDVANFLNVLVMASAQLHGLRQLLRKLENAQQNHEVDERLLADLQAHVAFMARHASRMQLSATQRIFDHLHFLPDGQGRRVAAALGQVESVRLNFVAVLQTPEAAPSVNRFMLLTAEQSIGVIARHLLHVMPVTDSPHVQKALRRAFLAADDDFTYADEE